MVFTPAKIIIQLLPLHKPRLVHTQIGQGASHQPTGEGNELWAGLQILPVLASFGQELKTVILKHVHALVVCSQVVDLFSVKQDTYQNISVTN